MAVRHLPQALSRRLARRKRQRARLSLTRSSSLIIGQRRCIIAINAACRHLSFSAIFVSCFVKSSSLLWIRMLHVLAAGNVLDPKPLEPGGTRRCRCPVPRHALFLELQKFSWFRRPCHCHMPVVAPAVGPSLGGVDAREDPVHMTSTISGSQGPRAPCVAVVLPRVVHLQASRTKQAQITYLVEKVSSAPCSLNCTPSMSASLWPPFASTPMMISPSKAPTPPSPSGSGRRAPATPRRCGAMLLEYV